MSMTIGAQLFTLREYTKNLDDFAETLKKVADIGYTTVQVSGTCAFSPDWLRDRLKETGLRCVLTHTPLDAMTADPQKVMADHTVFGCDHIGIGYYDLKENSVESLIEKLRPVGDAFAAGGKQLMYHNHDGEFRKVDGIVLLEHLFQALTPAQLGFTLDTFWVQAGGGDPIRWLHHLAGRVPCVHLKDMAYERKMAPVGSGNMNFEGILAACADAGARYLLVEQDDCYDEDPFDCLRQSYRYLTAQGLS